MKNKQIANLLNRINILEEENKKLKSINERLKLEKDIDVDKAVEDLLKLKRFLLNTNLSIKATTNGQGFEFISLGVKNKDSYKERIFFSTSDAFLSHDEIDSILEYGLGYAI